MRYGIPEFRLEKTILDEVKQELIEMGVLFQFERELGRNLNLEELNQYDAIFLGIGATIPSKYQLAETDFKNIYDPDFFLKEYNQGNKIENLGKTIVIGGGNVAIDCARTAKRMGAEKVTIVYRRDRENMPARESEIEDAIQDGVEIDYLSKVNHVVGQGGKIEKVKCSKTQIVDKKVIDVPNSDYEIEANTVIFAIGLTPDRELIEKQLGLELNEKGMIKLNDQFQTSNPKIYAGGDIAESKSTVCRAISAGKNAAIEIMKQI